MDDITTPQPKDEIEVAEPTPTEEGFAEEALAGEPDDQHELTLEDLPL